MSINLNQANLYFSNSNHIKHAIWAAFDDDDKTAAIGHAQRLIALVLDDTLDTETTDDDDFQGMMLQFMSRPCGFSNSRTSCLTATTQRRSS